MKRKQCFLIDDDPDDRSIFTMALESADASYECITAKNGLDAVNVIKSNPDFVPDFIFIDLNMPYMSGKETLQEIRNVKQFNTVPVIIYTTSSYRKDIEETKNLGASHFLVKPPRISSLIDTLSGILNKKGFEYYINGE